MSDGTEHGERKVGLEGLLFTMNWEDPALDRAAFELEPEARLATVCSGACNTFSFLLDDPSSILSFDYNPAQVWVLELKAACFERLDYAAMLEMYGVRPSMRRKPVMMAAPKPAVSSRNEPLSARVAMIRRTW